MTSTDLKISAVLQAAGSASRIGFRPKCLIEVDGIPLIVKKIQALQNAGVQDIVVVLGHYAKEIVERQKKIQTLSRKRKETLGVNKK